MEEGKSHFELLLTDKLRAAERVRAMPTTTIRELSSAKHIGRKIPPIASHQSWEIEKWKELILTAKISVLLQKPSANRARRRRRRRLRK